MVPTTRRYRFRPAERSLWRAPDFMRLWSAAAISELGDRVTQLALPLTAILTLGASPLALGALNAATFLPFVLIGLPAGVWVDRLRRRPVLIAADLGRALLLVSIPVAHWLDLLSLGQLLVVAFLVGGLTVFFAVAYHSYLPSLVGRERLVDGNAKLEIARSGGAVAGPAAAGGLVQLLTAPVAVLADAVSFLCSAAFVLAIRSDERPPERASRPGMRREISEGLRYVLGHPLLRVQAITTAVLNLFFGAFDAVFLLYATRDLGLSPGAVGAILAAGALAVPVGALLTGRIVGALGVGRAFLVAVTLESAAIGLVALAPQAAPIPVLVGAFLLLSFEVVIYNVTGVSLRQAITPERLLGRTNATMRFVVWGTIPAGALLGGALGEVLGLRATIGLAAAGALLALPVILASPLRRVRRLPEAVAESA